MSKKIKYEFNQQSATLRLREPITEGRVMFTIDDEQIDSLFNKQFEADVDYIHDGPDVYYVTDQNDLEKFVDYVESMGLDADRIQIQQYMKEDGNVTSGGEAYLPAMDVPSKKQNPFKEDALSGYKQNKDFRPGHTADKGGFQYKDLWGLNENKVIGKTKSGKDIYLDFNNPAHKDFTAADHDDASQALLTVKSQPGMRSKNTVTPMRKKAAKQHFDASKAKQKVKDSKELETKLAKSDINENKLSVLREIEQIVHEIFSKEDYKKVLQIIDKIKYTNTALYNKIMDLVDDLYPHDYKEVEKLAGLNENYSRFKNETKTRTKPEQFHQAVKSVKRKVEEIHKLYEYMERLKLELSESSDGLKYKKYTENAIFKIKEAVKALHIKTKKLK